MPACPKQIPPYLSVTTWSRPWLQPTDQTLESLPEQGVKNVKVLCPAFTADCLETLEEIAGEGKELFLAAGGERIPSSTTTHTSSVPCRCCGKLAKRRLPDRTCHRAGLCRPDEALSRPHQVRNRLGKTPPSQQSKRTLCYKHLTTRTGYSLSSAPYSMAPPSLSACFPTHSAQLSGSPRLIHPRLCPANNRTQPTRARGQRMPLGNSFEIAQFISWSSSSLLLSARPSAFACSVSLSLHSLPLRESPACFRTRSTLSPQPLQRQPMD